MPIDCEDYLVRSPNLPSGIYPIYPPGQKPITVYCDMKSYGGGWTVIQRRVDNTQEFYKNWNDYKSGFGELDFNFWLGLENIYRLTDSVNNYNMLVQLNSNDDELGLAYYENFYLESEQTGYVLRVKPDSCGNANDSLIGHVGQKFFTYDNDTNGVYKCASNAKGGWWYRDNAADIEACHDSNLNAYLSGTTPGTMATWKTFRGYAEPVKTTKLMIRRSPLPNVVKRKFNDDCLERSC